MAKKISIAGDEPEEFLQAQFAEISEEDIVANQKLLKIFKVLQSCLPFDLIVWGTRPFIASQFKDTGYLRVGFDEYQFIGEKELREITRVKTETLSESIQNSGAYNVATIYNDINKPFTLLQKVWTDFFKLHSCLVFPVSLGQGISVDYFFYSRQRDMYSNKHVALLNGLQNYFINISKTIIADESRSGQTMVQDATGKQGEIAGHPCFEHIIGSHPLLLAALDLASKVACYNTSVLILGESGTGKEKVAQSIHSLSKRKNGPFIKINCATIPATLIESELFGHEKGAFTGAIEKRKGKFELAHGGTIFLDEIGDLPLDMQVKLLRVLQEKEIEYVGGCAPKKVDVRIVAATNRDLEKDVAEGNFRLDLYYRLNVFPITLPPLRERRSDIQALALFFAKRFCRDFEKTFIGIAPSMMEDMCAYDWPGNIRELENVLEQSVVLNDGESKLELRRRLNVTTGSSRKVTIETFEDVRYIQRETEREYIISILQKTNGRIRGVGGTAELLNIKPTTLESKMAKLGIRREDFMRLIENLQAPRPAYYG